MLFDRLRARRPVRLPGSRSARRFPAERLSLSRLQRESQERGFTEDDISSHVYTQYMFRLCDLPDVVNALDPPPGFRTQCGAGIPFSCSAELQPPFLHQADHCPKCLLRLCLRFVSEIIL